MAKSSSLGRPTLTGFRDPTSTATQNGNIVNTPMYPGIGGFSGPKAYTSKGPVGGITPPGGRRRSTPNTDDVDG